MISTLDRKLLRNLVSMKGQVTAIMLIIACGVASFVAVVTAYRALEASRDSYYGRYRMADVWAPVKRAPRSVQRDLERIDGVRRVESRILFEVTLDLPGEDLPVSGRVISVPDRRQRTLNGLHLTGGRWFSGDGTREVIVADRFAAEHRLRPGDVLPVLMNNRKESLRIVATAQSPEYVYLIGPGAILPDPKHFTVLWLSDSFAEAVFDYEDACNEFTALLNRDAQLSDVIDEFDKRLARYGAYGAFGREDQISERYVSNEIAGLRGTATMVPVIFLGVAAFVLHVLMGRLVQTQRNQIALFRAFGYTSRRLIRHFLKLTLLVALLGAGLGTGLGLWFAHWLVNEYRRFFSFPVLDFSPDPYALTTGALVSIGFAVLGTLSALRRVARLDPAEGLRPESPRSYRRTIFERMPPLWARLGFGTRMILRHIARVKLRSAVTVVGIVFACSILVLAYHGQDAVDELMDVQFRLVERQDARVTFHAERGRAALYEIRRLAGVRTAEPELVVPVRLVSGWRKKRTAITGLERGQTLRGLVDRSLREVPLPPDGLLLSRKLADLIGVAVGDRVEVEVLTGRKPRFSAPVASVVDEYLGTFAYADIGRLSRWIGEEQALTGALLSIDPELETHLGRELKSLPAVAAVAFRKRTVKSFQDTMAASQDIMYTTMILFAGVIVFGVLYNAARISLAERERELGSLRVLGFSHREVSTVLIGENLLLVAVALPFGVGLGAFFSWVLTRVYDTDLYRFPFVLRMDSVLATVFWVMVFAAVANLLVARRLRRMDVVEVLKARE